MKFKVGDKVKVLKREQGENGNGQLTCLKTKIGDTGIISTINANDISLENNCVFYERELVFDKNYKEPKPNFLIKYDLDQETIEEIETLTAVKKRIKELVKD